MTNLTDRDKEAIRAIGLGPDNAGPVGTVVRIVTAQGDDCGLGYVYGATTEPVFLIESVDGRQGAWHQSLCREASVLEQLEYWKERAMLAERAKK